MLCYTQSLIMIYTQFLQIKSAQYILTMYILYNKLKLNISLD